MILIELMDRILPIRLEGTKKGGIQGLAFMCGVGREAKYHYSVFPCKLNRIGFEMRTMPVKYKKERPT